MNKDQHKHGHDDHEHHGHTGHEHHDHSNHEHHDHHGHEHHDHGGGHHHHHHGNFKEIFFKSLPIGLIIMLMSPLMGLTDRGLIEFPYS